MKEGIHPNYQQTTITCACGNVIETGSTKKDIKVEVCSKCHPSTPASRRWWTPADVSAASTRSSVWSNLSFEKPMSSDMGFCVFGNGPSQKRPTDRSNVYAQLYR